MSRTPLLLLLAACGVEQDPVTETGNPEMTMAYRARSSAPEAVGFDGSAAVQLDAVTVSIGRVRFVEGEDCDAPGEVEHDAPGLVADLLQEPQPVVFEVGEAAYCRVRVRFDQADALDDATFVLEGARSDGVPFTLVSDATPEIDLRSRSTPFTLSDARADLVMALDVAPWLADVDLDAATVADGTILVDAHENRDLLDAFEDAVEAALGLYDDPDQDGEVSEDDALATGG